MSWRAARGAAALGLALLAASSQAAEDAPKLADDAPKLADAGGSFRTIVVGSRIAGFEPPEGLHTADGLSQSLLRLTLQGGEKGRVRYEGHLVQELRFATTTNSASVLGPPGAERFRALGLSRELGAGPVGATLSADRLNLRLSLPMADLTLGRQAVDLAKAYLWNPLDVFAPFDPRTFDRDYKRGVDAARVDIPLGDFSSLTLIGALGGTQYVDPRTFEVTTDEGVFAASWYGSALLARASTTIAGFDLSLQGGKIYGGYQVGAGLSGELLTLGIRAEAAWVKAMESSPLTFPRPSGETFEAPLIEDHASFVVGVDRRFENSLYVTVEYFYNGEGAATADELLVTALRLRTGEIVNQGRHLVGAMATYEFHPLLNGRLIALLSVVPSPSVLLGPIFTYSISNEAELVFGAMLSFGERPKSGGLFPEPRSEFGSYPNVLFGEFKVYF